MDRERHPGRHDLSFFGRLLKPTPLHFASLLAGFALLLVLGRDQWFVYDDWAILHPSTTFAQVMAGHQGHWSATPTLIFQALRSTVGLHSYLPYLAAASIAHLAVAHLLWRLMLRAGVRPWLATATAAVVIVMGSAAENLLWAFQLGFMGAIALGLLVVLLLDAKQLARSRIVAVILVSLLSLTFSGTALPLLAAAFVLGWIRRGFVRTFVLFVPAGVVYVAWYLLFSGGTPTSLAPHGAAALYEVPLFFATMFGAGFGEFVGVVVLGPLVALALVAWLIKRFRHWRGVEAPAYALLVGSAVFAALTAASRSGGELSAAGAQRYVYLIVALAVPTMALALEWIASQRRALAVVAAISIVAVGAVNVVLLVARADEQAVTEQRVEREVSAALDVIGADDAATDGARLDGGAIPIPDLAPDLTVADLRDAAASHLLSPVPYTARDRARVERALTP